MAARKIDTRTAQGRGDKTRAAILQAAVELMAERGYEATTMRDVARRAGVSLGNAYYYFESKEHLVQAFYLRRHEAHASAAAEALATEKKLEARLRAALRAHLESMAPYHRIAGALFRNAADPESPLNPFGRDSADVRERAIALFGQVVDGSRDRLPTDLRAALPRLLWLLHLGVVLFWIHDRSAGRRRTFRLVDSACSFVGILVPAASLPFTGSLRRRGIALLDEAWSIT
jgi:AcrR family transcriptional regulator